METPELAVLEALADPRLEPISPDELASELAFHYPGAAVREPRETDLTGALRARTIEWAAISVTHGEILDAFATHCGDELDDVEVLEQTPSHLRLGWRREISSVELRAGFLFCERVTREGPALLLGELTEPLIARFLDDEGLRSRLAVYDLGRLEKVNAVRSSVFVYFEWFLRDLYGVKLLPADAFTRGLVERGIISLGMG